MTQQTPARVASSHEKPVRRERPDRDGQRLFSNYVKPDTLRAVKMLAVKQDTTNVALMHEAIALLLKRHGEPIPPSTIERLRETGRPLPDAPKAKAKANGHRHG